jgi:UDP-N-acetylglucosamine--N-acetylmuramyl-(pentapeptide) pyrophosphoryl-undecaprenol N-acetylglucosamine transferase
MCQNLENELRFHDTILKYMRIVLVGGGTGGHFYPLIAVAEELRNKYTDTVIEIFYIGPEKYNEQELQRLDITYVYCPAGKLRRYITFKNILDIFRTLGGLLFMWYKLFSLYPDVIFSKGSYTSVPILLMARFYRIPVVIHESDSKPGRANMLAKSFATYIGITYPDSIHYFPPERTANIGIPVRKALLQRYQDPHTLLGIPNDMPLIYVTGGSSGAERINALLLQSLQDLLPEYRIFHQTGPQHESTVIQTAQSLITDPHLLSRYYVKGTLTAEQVAALLDASTLVISRAGSTSLYEIALHRKPAIVIPIPEEISHDQRTNAYSYARQGGASVIEESNLTVHLLVAEIHSIIDNPEKYQKMQEGTAHFAKGTAATTIASVLYDIGVAHGS